MGSMTAIKMVNKALQELGLPQVDTILNAQDDQTGFQVLGLLNALGQQMMRILKHFSGNVDEERGGRVQSHDGRNSAKTTI